MEKIDLEKYKSAWKKDPPVFEHRLSEKEISGFLRSNSKDLLDQYKRTLVFDLIIKAILFLGICGLAVLELRSATRGFTWYLIAFLAFLTLAGIFFQFQVWKKIPQQGADQEPVVDKLKKYIDFFYRHYVGSIYVGATSSTLFFLVGSFYYFFNKYQEIPPLHLDDFIVFGVGILLSFGLSLGVQLKFNQLKIKQLEDCLDDTGEVTLDEAHLRTIQTSRKKTVLIFGIAMVLGLLLLLFFWFKIGGKLN